MGQPANIKLTHVWTPAGSAPTVTPGTQGGLSGGDIEKCKWFGSFLTNGASNPVAASNRGDPFVVVRSSAGLYLVTCGLASPNNRYFKLCLGIQAHLGKGAAGNALRAAVGLVVDASGTFQVRLEDAAGAATDLSAATDNRVMFEANWSIGAL